MPLGPDPFGLWEQAAIGTVFANSNFFFPWIFYTLVHYSIIWATSPANTLPPLEMAVFVIRMIFVFGNGTFSGVALVVALRTRDLIPTHTFRKGWPRLGIFFAVFAIVAGIRAVTILTGAYNAHNDFDLDPSDPFTQWLWWGILALTAVGFIGLMVLTYMDRKQKDFWSFFSITYADDLQNPLIVDYIAALVLVLGPQAIWDFLVLPPSSWPQLNAGILTIAIKIVAWAIIYYWFVRFRNINDTHFSRKHSPVWFGEFVLIVGGIQLVAGVGYLVAAEFLSTPSEAEWVVSGIMGVVVAISIVLFIVFARRQNDEKRRGKKAASDDGGEGGEGGETDPLTTPTTFEGRAPAFSSRGGNGMLALKR